MTSLRLIERNGPPLPEMEDVQFQQLGDLFLGPQAVRLDVPLQPVLRDGFEGFHRGLECRLPGADAGEGRLRLLAGLVDAECVGCADGGPFLLAGHRVAGDGRECLGAARLDADIVAPQLRVRLMVGLGPWLELGNSLVGQRFSHRNFASHLTAV